MQTNSKCIVYKVERYSSDSLRQKPDGSLLTQKTDQKPSVFIMFFHKVTAAKHKYAS
jgi:hypothetical protein